MAQQGVAVREIIEMVIEARLAADLRVGRQDRTVGAEDELSEPISGVSLPDHGLTGVGNYDCPRQFAASAGSAHEEQSQLGNCFKRAALGTNTQLPYRALRRATS